MLSVSIAYLTYEGLARNVRVTYAERMPGVLGASTKFIDFMASHISSRFRCSWESALLRMLALADIKGNPNNFSNMI